jgi:hypothetical protein
LSKKLKKKIEELCGLIGLDWEARQKRAEQILSNNSRKQDLCNDLQGLSFRELEQHLQGVATERQKKEEGYERKLAIYNEKTSKLESVRRSPIKPAPKPKPPVRTLEEILQQVYAPRVDPQPLTPDEKAALKLHRTRDGQGPPVLSDPLDIDDLS